jgi:hypothetical protein
MEWWTPMKGKQEGKRALARECWTRRWEKELTLLEVIHCSIVLVSHKLPSHQKTSPPTTHVISEASAVAAIATLASHGVVVDGDEEWEDRVTIALREARGIASIGCQPTPPSSGLIIFAFTTTT